MIRGVDTLTSTPQASVNSHSLLGWLTRPTVRGTPNSVFARSDVTRLALSSPVAAITTSQCSSWASSSEESSQESASSHSASGTRSGLIEPGSLSISSTSWPLPISSRATDRPTAPAPAMATLIFRGPCGGTSAASGVVGCSCIRLRSAFDDLVDVGSCLLAHHHVERVALLDHRLPGGEDSLTQAVDPGDPGIGLPLERDALAADPGLG